MRPESKPKTPFDADSLHRPLVAILRGVPPDGASDIAAALLDVGISLIEVPLNRPGALQALSAMVRDHGDRAVLGAGTVLRAEQVAQVAAVGGRWAVSPNYNPLVLGAALAEGLWAMPGVATPSEAFAAWEAGAHALKLFPNQVVPPAALKAWRTVLTMEVPLFPVGGMNADNLLEYRAAGASGAGFGSALYQPGDDAERVRARAEALVRAWAMAAPA